MPTTTKKRARRPTRTPSKPSQGNNKRSTLLRLRMPPPFMLVSMFPAMRAARLVRIRPYRVPSTQELLAAPPA